MYSVKRFNGMDTFTDETGHVYEGFEAAGTVYAVVNDNGVVVARNDCFGKMHVHFYSTKIRAVKMADMFNNIDVTLQAEEDETEEPTAAPALPKISKTAISRFLKWSSSRYNEMNKAEAVQYAYDVLTGNRQIEAGTVIECGGYTPHSTMTGKQYYIDVVNFRIVDCLARWDSFSGWTVTKIYDTLQF